MAQRKHEMHVHWMLKSNILVRIGNRILLFMPFDQLCLWYRQLFFYCKSFSTLFFQRHAIRTLVPIGKTLNEVKWKSSNGNCLCVNGKLEYTANASSFMLHPPIFFSILIPKMSRCVLFHSLSFAYCIGDFEICVQ